MNEHLKTASHDRPFAGKISVRPDPLLQVMPRSSAAGFAGHSVAATRKLLQERGETFRDRLVGGIVLGPEPLPEFPQPWPSGQDVTTFGLARPTLPALAPTTKFSAARGVPLDA